MFIAKPYQVLTATDCYNNEHKRCPGRLEAPELTTICNCGCHYGEETTMSETTNNTTSKRVYTKWTSDQIQTLRDNAQEGSAKVAELLGRPESQVKTKAASLGVSLRKTGSNGGRRQKPRN